MIFVAGRIFSSLGINHIVLKGINGQPIFLDDEDKKFFLNLLNSKLSSQKFILISYCLMTNHVHLLLKEFTLADSSNLMRNFISYYSSWFNSKHNRTSSLFKQKFYNECIESENQLLNTIKYIHENPVKAGIVKFASNYPWSSFNDYLTSNNALINTNYIDHFSINKTLILSSNIKYQSIKDDNSELYLKSYDYVFDCIKDYLNGSNIFDFLKMNSSEQQKLIQHLVKEKRFSERKIAKIFNFSPSKISRICNTTIENKLS